MLHRISEQEFTAMKQRVRGGVEGHANRSSSGQDTVTDGVYTRRSREAGSSPARKRTQRLSGPSEPVSIPAPSPYKNKWESYMARDLDLQLRAGMIASWQYERITFRLAYRQYHRTDFVIGHLDRSVELRQVKGWHKNLRAGIKGLKWAAKLFPMFTWTLARWNGQAFDVETVTV